MSDRMLLRPPTCPCWLARSGQVHLLMGVPVQPCSLIAAGGFGCKDAASPPSYPLSPVASSPPQGPTLIGPSLAYLNPPHLALAWTGARSSWNKTFSPQSTAAHRPMNYPSRTRQHYCYGKYGMLRTVIGLDSCIPAPCLARHRAYNIMLNCLISSG